MPEELVLLIETMKFSSVTVKEIKTWTEHDSVLSTIRRFVKHGWPKSVKPEFCLYHSRKLELRWLSFVEKCNCSKARKRTTVVITA